MVVAGRVVRRRRHRGRRDHDGRGRGHRAAWNLIKDENAPGADRGGRRAGPRGGQAVHRAARAARSSSSRRRPPSRPPSSRSSSTTRRRLRRPSRPAVADDLAQALDRSPASTSARPRIDELKERVKSLASPSEFAGREKEFSAAYRSVQKKLVRQRILRDKVRIDGRGLADIRPLSRRGRGPPARARLGAVRARRDADPRRHHAEHAPAWSSRSTRCRRRRSKRYMHNYNFPPYSHR